MATSILQVNLSSGLSGQSQSTGELKAPELEKRLNDLATALSGFKSTLSEFKAATKEQILSSKQQHQQTIGSQRIAQADIAKQTTQTKLDIEKTKIDSIAAKTAASERLTNLAKDRDIEKLKLRQQIQDERFNFTRENRAYREELSARIKEQRGRANAKFIGAGLFDIAAVGAKNYINANVGIGKSTLENPMTNGYDYGGSVANIETLSAKKNYGLLETGLTVLGTLIGARFGGVKGAIGGGTVGATAAGVIGAYGIGQAELKSGIDRDIVNNRLRLEALSATNGPAYSAASSVQGKNPLSNVETPFVRTIAQSLSVYNHNTDAVTKLTRSILDFSKAAQLDEGTTAQIAGSTGYLSRLPGFNFENTKSLFKAYGTTDYAGALNNAVTFAQAGFSPQKAQELAMQYQSTIPSAQNAAANFYGSSTNRYVNELTTQAIAGFSLEAYSDPKNPGHKAAFARASQLADYARKNPHSSQAMINDVLLKNVGGAYGVPLVDMLNESAAGTVSPTKTQQDLINATNRNRQAAAGGTLDASAAGKELLGLATGASQASNSASELNKQFMNLANTLSGVTKIIGGGFNTGFSSNSAGSTQSKNH